jgi:hypothetical protein
MTTPIGLQSISATLRGYGAPELDGFRSALGSALLQRYRPPTSASIAAQVELFTIDTETNSDLPAPGDIFAASVAKGFEEAARLLSECDFTSLNDWRFKGGSTDIFLDGWAANEQIDLVIPVAFIAQCARLHLNISLCTND